MCSVDLFFIVAMLRYDRSHTIPRYIGDGTRAHSK